MISLSLRILRGALLCTTLLSVSSPPLRATDASLPDPTGWVQISLGRLPKHETPAYAKLRATAGDGQVVLLEMTQAEVWTVRADRAVAFRKVAKQAGLAVSEVGTAWTHPLVPMKPHLAMSAKQNDMMGKAMATPAASGVEMMALPEAQIIEYALTNTSADGSNSIVLPIKGTTVVAAVRERLEKTADGYIWHGSISGTGDPVTLIWHMEGRLSGQFTVGGEIYAIRHLGGDLHGVVALKSKMLPIEHAPMDQALKKKMHMQEDPLVTKGDAGMLRPQTQSAPSKSEPLRNLQDAEGSAAQGATKLNLGLSAPSPVEAGPNVVIDVLVAYTSQAASYYMDIRQDLIELAIEDANQSFRNSGIGNVRLRLVHSYQTDYKESGTHFEHVFRFADKDGVMDEVLALRETYKADVAVLIVHDTNGCGLAAGVAPPQERAFAVVSQECAATKYSIAHEIGHLIGARHDFALDDSTMPFSYGHGFVSGKAWRTMMGYENTCDGCPRLPIWSNPRILIRGVAAGDATADNARVISEQAARVAAFR